MQATLVNMQATPVNTLVTPVSKLATLASTQAMQVSLSFVSYLYNLQSLSTHILDWLDCTPVMLVNLLLR